MMKKIAFIFSVCLLFAATAQAQDYKKFKVGLGAGYAIPGGKGAGGGVLLYLEPAYRVTDELLIGLRGEAAIVARGFADDNSVSLDAALIGSWSLNAQYYLSNNTFRPFVGAGFGIFNLTGASITGDPNNPNTTETAKETKVGFYPRVGFDVGHFTLSLDYNIIPTSSTDTGDLKNSYFGIRVGGFFGGGRK